MTLLLAYMIQNLEFDNEGRDGNAMDEMGFVMITEGFLDGDDMGRGGREGKGVM